MLRRSGALYCLLAVGGHFGPRAPGVPISCGKGIDFNSLCPTDFDRIDTIADVLDHCVEGNAYK